MNIDVGCFITRHQAKGCPAGVTFVDDRVKYVKLRHVWHPGGWVSVQIRLILWYLLVLAMITLFIWQKDSTIILFGKIYQLDFTQSKQNFGLQFNSLNTVTIIVFKLYNQTVSRIYFGTYVMYENEEPQNSLSYTNVRAPRLRWLCAATGAGRKMDRWGGSESRGWTAGDPQTPDPLSREQERTLFGPETH